MNVDMRLHPRVKVDLPAELEPFRGDCLDVRVIHLSLSGVLVEGNAELEALLGARLGLASGAPLELNLHFGLEQESVHCHCRIIHSRRLAQDCFQVGMKILSIPNASQGLLSHYIEAHMN
ncbi:PilZ domain-containing protein [Marinobacterium sedimentorum]|uniref:PilZ domain-containing protein n=1 Tax=Marinobacterium sedimentorum TaxID=2927804 RepID=UPI0020C6B967|nr:PilZ domain-containing protein [Marinobacterium sedimentorum]MCP8690224.1 PilZ domain-containing protein [Marinobacterium sedimentorum]